MLIGFGLAVVPPARGAEPEKKDQPAAQQPAAGPELKSEDDKTLYAMGLMLNERTNLSMLHLSESELRVLADGLIDGALGRPPKADLTTYGPKIQALAQARVGAVAAAEKEASKAFLDKAAAEPGAKRTESGIIFRELKPGTGASPQLSDTVKIHYHGTVRDGTVFDSSVERGTPAEFRLAALIPCWKEALPMMKVGGKVHIVCPSDQAYGDQGSPPKIPPGAALAFDIELLDIVKPATPPASATPAPPAPAPSTPATPPPATPPSGGR
ncbi:MAG: FKBP-type peptidyl-prolyl cis-trans isomerase [Acidobacteria bacterium]|nr:FKBP-type peptidyl-prolyl cis-trans isomerase [Acidobacteriota bacterium]